tara:strand:+ start:11234 stop:11650 length:417 start_codon:yes stop_codon:yes gene_type:complete
MSNATRKKATPKKSAPKPDSFEKATSDLTHTDIVRSVESFFSTMKPNGKAKTVSRKGRTGLQVRLAKIAQLQTQVDAIIAVSRFIDTLVAQGRDVSRESVTIDGETRNLERIAIAMEACRLETKSDVLADCCAAFCQA